MVASRMLPGSSVRTTTSMPSSFKRQKNMTLSRCNTTNASKSLRVRSQS